MTAVLTVVRRQPSPQPRCMLVCLRKQIPYFGPIAAGIGSGRDTAWRYANFTIEQFGTYARAFANVQFISADGRERFVDLAPPQAGEPMM
ncbi:hypothetical protein [Streptomyces sp. NPDC001719]